MTRGSARRTARSLPLVLGLLLLLPGTANAQDVIWLEQRGTPQPEVAYDAAADASGAFVVGFTDGPLGGQTQFGLEDAFIQRYAGDGRVLWTRLWGTSSSDVANAVAENDTGVFIGGRTGGDGDAFVASYDLAGGPGWSDTFGTTAFGAYDQVDDIAADAMGVYVAGEVSHRLDGLPHHGDWDIVIRKYTTDGTVVWTKEIGTPKRDVSGNVALDGAGHLYVSGQTAGAFPGYDNPSSADVFVRKYDLDGNSIWTREFGTTSEANVLGSAANENGLYLSGYTWLSFGPPTGADPEQQAYVMKIRPRGQRAWVSEFGSTGESQDFANGVSLAGRKLFVGGTTYGTLPGQTSAGNLDAFVALYTLTGSQTWLHQLGTSEDDNGFGVGAAAGRAFLVGSTAGTFPGEVSRGGGDEFVAKVR
ncbi:MAG: hypothetical protein ACJ758_07500 [Actinomycetota bacterium]